MCGAWLPHRWRQIRHDRLPPGLTGAALFGAVLGVFVIVALAGSSNMDIRSFQLDFELMLLVCGRSFTDEL